MRFSHALIHTVRETPSEAEVVSHRLMLRAGMIHKVAAGIYAYLPLALRSLTKIMAIVREEMVAAGAQELLMPAVQPAELWQQSGRWEQYGRELLRLHDRHDREFCLGPTHEEVITDIVRAQIRSWRQLPVNLFQIQAKFRDEIRPRFGLMRGREFIMKDGYSFDRDDAGASATYERMHAAYRRIFARCGLRCRPVGRTPAPSAAPSPTNLWSSPTRERTRSSPATPAPTRPTRRRRRAGRRPLPHPSTVRPRRQWRRRGRRR